MITILGLETHTLLTPLPLYLIRHFVLLIFSALIKRAYLLPAKYTLRFPFAGILPVAKPTETGLPAAS